MLNRRLILSAVALGIVVFSGASSEAITKRMFDQKAFEAAQAAGQSILVEVHASWCPVCKRQRPILAKLGTEAKFKRMVSFEIDFDSQKDLVRRFNVHKQSTLIVFKGRKEIARSTGDSNPGSIEQLLTKSL
ncbi:MAG: thioredoxin [Rhizobiales bacterium]|nr:thioredoxin [Hyphomicrobiales bacterium]